MAPGDQAEGAPAQRPRASDARIATETQSLVGLDEGAAALLIQLIQAQYRFLGFAPPFAFPHALRP